MHSGKLLGTEKNTCKTAKVKKKQLEEVDERTFIKWCTKAWMIRYGNVCYYTKWDFFERREREKGKKSR